MNTQVKSADRVLDILELFASTDRALGLREVYRSLALPKSSTHQLLATLEKRGYLERGEGDLFTIPEALREGGWIGGIAGRIYRAAQPALDRLVRETEESVVLGAPTASYDVRILSHRVSPLAVRFEVSRTSVIPGYCTAMGHAILSCIPPEQARMVLEASDRKALTPNTVTETDAILLRLEQARQQGFALNIDERFEGAAGAAIAIRDPDGHPHAALNVVSLTPRFRRKQWAVLSALARSVTEIEAAVFGHAHRDQEVSA